MNKIKINFITVILSICIILNVFQAFPNAVKEILSNPSSITTEKEMYKKSMTQINLAPFSWKSNESFNNNCNVWYNGNDAGDYNIHGLIFSRANILSGNKVPSNYISVVNEYSQRCDIDWRVNGKTPCNAFHGVGNYIANLKYLCLFAKEISKHKSGNDITADANYADVVVRSKFSDEILNNSVFVQLSDVMKKIIISNYQVTEPNQTEGERCKYITLGVTMHLIGDLYAHRIMVPVKSLNLSNKKFDYTTMFDSSDFCMEGSEITSSNGKSWEQFVNDVSNNKIHFSAVKDYIRRGVKKGIYEDSPEFYPERFYESIYSAACYLTHFEEDFNISILSPVSSLKLYCYDKYYNAVQEKMPDNSVSAVKPIGITLNKTSYNATSLKTIMLSAAVAPGFPTNYDVLWTSTNSSVATVNSQGKVVLQGFGNCSIISSLRSNPNVNAICKITVTKPKKEFDYTIRNNGTIQIEKYNWTSSTIKIPSKIGNRKVTAIKSLNNFSNCFAKVQKIQIPSTVRLIKSICVDELEYLKEIKVDKDNKNYSSKNGVLFNKKKTTLYSYPICKSNNSYTVPSSVIRIDNKSFCRSILKSLKMHNNVTKIGASAFYFSRYLSNVTLSKKLTFIGKEAFCSTSISKITIPSTVTIIGNNALGLWCAGGPTGHSFLNNCTIKGKNFSAAYWYAKYNKIPFIAE